MENVCIIKNIMAFFGFQMGPVSTLLAAWDEKSLACPKAVLVLSRRWTVPHIASSGEKDANMGYVRRKAHTQALSCFGLGHTQGYLAWKPIIVAHF